jgi:hypothetical protein
MRFRPADTAGSPAIEADFRNGHHLRRCRGIMRARCGQAVRLDPNIKQAAEMRKEVGTKL